MHSTLPATDSGNLDHFCRSILTLFLNLSMLFLGKPLKEWMMLIPKILKSIWREIK